MRKVILLDQETEAERIPKGIGIRIIAVLDESDPKHFRVIRTFTSEEAWGDI